MKTEQSLLYFIFKRSALKRVPTMALHKDNWTFHMLGISTINSLCKSGKKRLDCAQ